MKLSQILAKLTKEEQKKVKNVIVAGAMQKKLMDELKKIADVYNLDFDAEYNYSNSGAIYFRDGLKTVYKIKFSFQDSYVTFDVDANYGGGSYYIEYTDEAKLKNFLKTVDTFLKSKAPKANIKNIKKFVEFVLNNWQSKILKNKYGMDKEFEQLRKLLNNYPTIHDTDIFKKFESNYVDYDASVGRMKALLEQIIEKLP